MNPKRQKHLTPEVIKQRPIHFRGVLRDFKVGQLCYVVARRYHGNGPVRLILHKVELASPESSFGYGAFGHWIVSPGSLIASPRSKEQILASRINGAKGGRPANL